MSADIGQTLGKQIGPFPVGVWLVIVGGGLFLGIGRRSAGAPDAAEGVAGDTIESEDQAAFPLSPVYQFPTAPAAGPVPGTIPSSSLLTRLPAYYTIRSTDKSLFDIAARFNTTHTALWRLNYTRLNYVARQHGYPDAANGWRIFAGTVIRTR